MATGENGPVGHHVIKNAEEEKDDVCGYVIILHRNIEERIALDHTLKIKIAIGYLVVSTEASFSSFVPT